MSTAAVVFKEPEHSLKCSRATDVEQKPIEIPKWTHKHTLAREWERERVNDWLNSNFWINLPRSSVLLGIFVIFLRNEWIHTQTHKILYSFECSKLMCIYIVCFLTCVVRNKSGADERERAPWFFLQNEFPKYVFIISKLSGTISLSHSLYGIASICLFVASQFESSICACKHFRNVSFRRVQNMSNLPNDRCPTFYNLENY